MNTLSKLSTLIFLASALAASQAAAAAQSYDFKDPKGVNTVRFSLDAPLESISGTTNGVSGTVTFDPAEPAKMDGEIIVDATTLTVPNPVMQEHLHGDRWLNTSENETIRFVARKIEKVENNGQSYEAHVTGDFTLNGTTKELTVPVKLTYLPGKLADRTNGDVQGDLLVMRATFTVNRSEFGIMPGQATNKVAEEVEIDLAIAGASPSA